ncbi:MAG: RluA family pseudouridine synthase [Pelosinus sp.]|nr:RluA family pseudouridine synthase [Pelosinus sp.]
MKTFVKHNIAAEQAGLTVEKYLKEFLNYSGRKIQKLTRKKGILLNGKTAYLQKTVKLGDTLQVLTLEDASYGVNPEKGSIDILYEDEYLMVLNKPAYQLVHPTGQTKNGTLANFLAYYFEERGILTTIRAVHRLDRETSGCILFAKSAYSQTTLEQQLTGKVLRRTYQALVRGIVTPSAGTIDAPIGPHPSLPNRRVVALNGEKAITHYQTIKTYADASLLELSLETGRTHQIRVHLSHHGYPIIGDKMYGVRTVWMPRQALHASSLTFEHIKSKSLITVHAPLSADFENALDYVTTN